MSRRSALAYAALALALSAASVAAGCPPALAAPAHPLVIEQHPDAATADA